MYQEIKYYAKDEPEKLPETEIHNTFKTFGAVINCATEGSS
jgi:hypothetical protein